MNNRFLILTATAAALALISWSRSRTAHEPMAPPVPSQPSASIEQAHEATLLLFADPDEAEDSCECAEIIRLVREVSGTPGVLVREIDSRRPGEDARSHGVRLSPTVIFLDEAGREYARFEGESSATIRALRSALTDLPHSSEPMKNGADQ